MILKWWHAVVEFFADMGCKTSIHCVLHRLNTGSRSRRLIDHSIRSIWHWTRYTIGLYIARARDVNRENNNIHSVSVLRSLIKRQVNRKDLVPPSCLMFETTVALSHIRRTTLWHRNGRKLHTAYNKASISNRLICCCCWAVNHQPMMLQRSNWAPKPNREASVNSVISYIGLEYCQWQAAANGACRPPCNLMYQPVVGWGWEWLGVVGWWWWWWWWWGVVVGGLGDTRLL